MSGMIPIKIICQCGQKYAFDVQPVDGQMPVSVNCPACGRDGTVAAASRSAPLVPRLSDVELESHARFVASLGKGAIWLDYRPLTPVLDAERNALAG